MNIFALILSLALAQFAGVIGSVFTASSVREWYVDLVMPSFAPPSWVFAPVWITLYLLMGVAAFLVWRVRKHVRVKNALMIYSAQLVLNATWSFLFFGLRAPGVALIEIVVLWVAIVCTIITFYRVSKPAAWLLAPYLAWVTFATYLNFAIWLLN